MAGPIDYTVNPQAIANVRTAFEAPLRGFQGGFAVRDALDQREAQAAQAQAKAQAAAQMQADLAAFSAKQNRTSEDYASMVAKYPQLSEHYKRAFDIETPDRKAAQVSKLSRVYAAVQSGSTDIAVSLLDDEAEAARNSGDKKTAAASEAMSRLIKLNPGSAQTAVGLALHAATGDEKFAEVLAKLGGEKRAAAKAPAEQATAEATARKTAAEATTAEAKAAIAPEQLAAETGLTRAQTDEALARVKKTGIEIQKLGVDIQKALLEIESGTPIDPEKRFDLESKLRKEYATQTATFQDVRESYRRIQASHNDAAGDLSLIFGFMKMLDPGSVVREGEFANAQNAAGVPERVQNIYNKLMEGERLTEGQRKAFRGQAKSLMDAAQTREKSVRAGLGRVVKSYKLNEENVFIESEQPALDSFGARTTAAPGATSAQRPPLSSFQR